MHGRLCSTNGTQMPPVCCAVHCCVMLVIASMILCYLHALTWETQLPGVSATIQAAAGCSHTSAEPSSAMPWRTSVLLQATSSFNSAAPHQQCPYTTASSSPGSHAVSHCPSLATRQPPQHYLPSAITSPCDGDTMDTDAAMTQGSMSSQAEQQHLGLVASTCTNIHCLMMCVVG